MVAKKYSWHPIKEFGISEISVLEVNLSDASAEK